MEITNTKITFDDCTGADSIKETALVKGRKALRKCILENKEKVKKDLDEMRRNSNNQHRNNA